MNERSDVYMMLVEERKKRRSKMTHLNMEFFLLVASNFSCAWRSGACVQLYINAAHDGMHVQTRI